MRRIARNAGASSIMNVAGIGPVDVKTRAPSH
jgi:hypothetical protein